MSAQTLHYVHDPLCGWCYAAAPLVHAAANAGIPIVMHAGGMISAPTRISDDMRRHIMQADRRITGMTGMPFGAAYQEYVLQNPDAVYWSRPAIAAILTAAALRPGAHVQMLREIQTAHYVDGQTIADTQTLVKVAETLGFDITVFAHACERVDVDTHIATTRRLMVQWGLRGFPGFVVERDGQFTRVGHEDFYGRPADFLNAVSP